MSHTCLNAYVCAQASGLFDALCHQGLVRLVKKGICACSWESVLLNILLRCTNPHVGLFPFDYGLSWRDFGTSNACSTGKAVSQLDRAVVLQPRVCSMPWGVGWRQLRVWRLLGEDGGQSQRSWHHHLTEAGPVVNCPGKCTEGKTDLFFRAITRLVPERA